jgi:hypothetical protein
MSLEINRAVLFGYWLHFCYGGLLQRLRSSSFAMRVLTATLSRATIFESPHLNAVRT